MRADNEWDFRGVRCQRHDFIEYDERGEAENRKTTFEAAIGELERPTRVFIVADLCPCSCDESDLETWLLAGCPKRTGYGPLTKGDLAYLLVIRRAEQMLAAELEACQPGRNEIVACADLHSAMSTPAFIAIKIKAWPHGPRNPFTEPARSTEHDT